MPRKTLIRSNVHPYHVTARTNNREDFPIPIGSFWKEFNDLAYEITIFFQVKIHAAVVMPNHFHVLLTASNEDLGTVMRHFMGSVTRRVNLKSGRTGRIFGGRYHWTLIDSESYFLNALKYVYRNPVRASICSRVENYEYSTIQGILDGGKRGFPLWYPFGRSDQIFLPDSPEALIHWLNIPFGTEREQIIQKALRRTRFDPGEKLQRRALESMDWRHPETAMK